MPNKIKPRRSYTANSVPLVSDLDENEMAVNWTDGKLFVRQGNAIVTHTLGGSGSGGGGSAEDTVLRALFVPPAPTNLTAAAGNAQVALSWTAPTVLAQTPITDYVVQFSTNSGSTWTTFADGTSTSTSATVTGLTNGTAYVFRVAAVNGAGTGAYSTASSAVTPASGDPLFGNVSLLLHMDGSGSTFVDSSAYGRTVTANGSVTQSTTQSKFGGKSAAFANSDSDRISVQTGSMYAFGTGDFVVEGWIFQASQNQYTALLEIGDHLSSAGIVFLTGTDGFRVYSNGFFGSGGTATLNQWQHVAFARSSGTLRVYLDGALASQQAFTNDLTNTSQVTVGYAPVGGNNSGSYRFNGYIDDLRITKGSNRGYTGATITVPTAAFPDA